MDFRAPQFPIVLRTWIQQANTLLLAPSTQAPFVPPPQPNPRGAEHPVALRTWIQQTNPLLYPNDTSTKIPREAIITRIPGRPDSEPRGFIGPNLLESTLAAPPPKPFSQTDWPVPAGPVSHINRTWTQPGNAILPQPPGATPFNQTDWPVPRGAVPGISLRTGTDGYRLPLITVDAGKPFKQDDWPVPQGPRPGVVTNRTWTDGNRLPLTTGAPPFKQTDWPVPRGPEYPASLRTWTGGGGGSPLVIIIGWRAGLTSLREHTQFTAPIMQTGLTAEGLLTQFIAVDSQSEFTVPED